MEVHKETAFYLYSNLEKIAVRHSNLDREIPSCGK